MNSNQAWWAGHRVSTRRRPRQGRGPPCGALRTFTEYSSILSTVTCSVIKGLHSCPTFMYNWLRPVSCGQAGPTRSRPTRGLGRQPECWSLLDHTLPGQLESFTPSTPYIRVQFKLLLHSCTHSSYSPRPALLNTRPCTPLPALLYTVASTCGVKAFIQVHRVLAV